MMPHQTVLDDSDRKMITTLINGLAHEPEWNNRVGIQQALEQIGEYLAYPEAIDLLVAMLNNLEAEWDVRYRAASILASMGPAAGRYANVITSFVTQLNLDASYHEHNVTEAVIKAIGQYGPYMTQHPELGKLLHEWIVRGGCSQLEAVLETLFRLSPELRSSVFLCTTVLQRINAESESAGQWQVAKALLVFGKTLKLVQGADAVLIDLLDSPKDEILSYIVEALIIVGFEPPVLDTIVKRARGLIRSSESYTCERGIRLLELLNLPILPADLIDVLFDTVQRERAYNSPGVVTNFLLSREAEWSRKPEITRRLKSMLEGDDTDEQLTACRLLVAVKQEEFYDDILDILIGMINDFGSGKAIRFWASRSLADLMPNLTDSVNFEPAILFLWDMLNDAHLMPDATLAGISRDAARIVDWARDAGYRIVETPDGAGIVAPFDTSSGPLGWGAVSSSPVVVSRRYKKHYSQEERHMDPALFSAAGSLLGRIGYDDYTYAGNSLTPDEVKKFHAAAEHARQLLTTDQELEDLFRERIFKTGIFLDDVEPIARILLRTLEPLVLSGRVVIKLEPFAFAGFAYVCLREHLGNRRRR